MSPNFATSHFLDFNFLISDIWALEFLPGLTLDFYPRQDPDPQEIYNFTWQTRLVPQRQLVTHHRTCETPGISLLGVGRKEFFSASTFSTLHEEALFDDFQIFYRSCCCSCQ